MPTTDDTPPSTEEGGVLGEERETIVHLSTRTRRWCESCQAQATVVLEDGSAWCAACDAAARRLGYDEPHRDFTLVDP